MLWALASLGITPEPAWLQQLLQEVSRRQAQKQLSPQHLANLGWALAKLGHRPDRDWSARCVIWGPILLLCATDRVEHAGH